MATFKDYLTSDLDNFFNLDEFAETHNINGIDMPIIIDNDELKEIQKRRNHYFEEAQGIYNVDLFFYVKKIDFGDRPGIMQNITLDGELNQVADVKENGGVFEIALMRRGL